jgi:hypothetical protein
MTASSPLFRGDPAGLMDPRGRFAVPAANQAIRWQRMPRFVPVTTSGGNFSNRAACGVRPGEIFAVEWRNHLLPAQFLQQGCLNTANFSKEPNPMAQNTLPSGIHDLMWLGVRMLSGRETYGLWLKLGTADDLRTALAEMRESEAAWAIARSRKAAAGERNTRADEALTAWLAKARLVMMLARGGEWSERWLETGFVQRSTQVPKRLGARIEVAHGVIAFLTAHPETEVPFAQVTAAAGQAIVAELQAAQKALRETTSTADPCKRRRDAAEKALRWQMRGTRIMVSGVLDKADARWLAFGLKIPNPSAKVPLRRALLPGASEVIATGEFAQALPENPAQAVA